MSGQKEALIAKTLCCIRCGACRGVTQDKVPDLSFSTQCPCGMTLFGAYEPAGLMYCARGIAQGTLAWSKELAEVVYACTLCGYCDDLCRRSIRCTPAIEILEELRTLVPTALKPKTLASAAETIRPPLRNRLSLLKSFGIADVSEAGSSGTIFFPDGTLLNNSPKLREIGHILARGTCRVGCFIEEPLPPVSTALINGGYKELLAGCVAEIDARLSRHGIRRVIVYNPESLSVLKRFSRHRASFVSITRFYADMLKGGKRKRVKLPPVTYHDPCHLGRYAQDYTSPREVLAGLGLQVREMWRSRENSLCCGAGGGVSEANPALAGTYAAHRWREARATGARVLVTACPRCHATLADNKPRGFTVADITSLVAQAWGYKGKSR